MASYSGVWTSPAGHNWACCSPTKSAGAKCSNAWNLALAEISCPSRAKPASARALSKALQQSSNCAAVSALAEEEGMLKLQQNGRLLASISQGAPAPESNRSECTGIKHQASPVNPAKLQPQPRKGNSPTPEQYIDRPARNIDPHSRIIDAVP